MKINVINSLLVMLLISITFSNCGKGDDDPPIVEAKTPTSINLSNDIIYEKLPSGTVIGELSTDLTVTGIKYKIVSGEGDTDNSDFVIVGNLLKTLSIFEYAEGNSKTVRVEATNKTKTYEQALIVNLNEFTGTYPSISSPSFNDNELMPTNFGADNGNVSPDLDIMDVPANTVSMVLTMVDIDFFNSFHWLVWNIPPDKTTIGQNESWPSGTVVGDNDLGTGYIGPFPPSVHRYVITVYFLSEDIDLSPSNFAQIPNKVAGKILAQISITGKYEP